MNYSFQDADRMTTAVELASPVRRDCAKAGHRYEVVSLDGEPVEVRCLRSCGQAWKVGK